MNAASNNGTTSLMLAALKGHLKVAKYLVRAGVAMDAERYDGMTALMYASRNEHTEMVEYLVGEKVSSINDRNKQGDSVLMLAADRGHLEVARYLVDSGAGIVAAEYDKVISLLVSKARADQAVLIEEIVTKLSGGKIQMSAMLVEDQNKPSIASNSSAFFAAAAENEQVKNDFLASDLSK